MNDRPDEHPPEAEPAKHEQHQPALDAVKLPPAGTIWALRFLAAVGLGVAMFLLGSDLAAWWAGRHATVPFCGSGGWVDCASVLNSQWSKWLGLPVAGAAVVVYAVILALLLWMRPTRVPGRLGMAWALLHGLTVLVAGGAAWFIYLQLGPLQSICNWCMIEHLVGVTLTGLVWLHGLGVWWWRPRAALGSVAVGLLGVGVLIAGQMLFSPPYMEVVVGTEDPEGRYVEPGAEANPVVVAGGQVVLNPEAHPGVGVAGAERFAVEVMDFTCPRCRRLSEVLSAARQRVEPKVGVLVVIVPLGSECNPLTPPDPDPRHARACPLARLAYAVWLADPALFENYYHWLFKHQDEMTVERAEDRAAALIGRGELEAMKVDKRIDQLIDRDIRIAMALKVGRLPGLFAGHYRMAAMPEDPAALADMLRRAWEEPVE